MKTSTALIGAGLALLAIGGAVAAFGWDKWVEIPRQRAGVLGALKDPSSANFRNERLRAGFVCGEVNARNSQGGYVGFKRYLSTATRYALEEHGSKGWLAQGDEGEIVRRIERTTKFLREQGRNPTAEENNQAEFDHLWANYCTL